MPHQPHATGEHAMLADLGAAGNTHAGGHGGVIANLYVVSDLDLVIELHTVTDHGIGQGSAIHSSVHTDLHIVADQYATDLGNLVPDTFGVGKAKAFAADNSTGLYDHTLTNTHIVVESHAVG